MEHIFCGHIITEDKTEYDISIKKETESSLYICFFAFMKLVRCLPVVCRHAVPHICDDPTGTCRPNKGYERPLKVCFPIENKVLINKELIRIKFSPKCLTENFKVKTHRSGGGD